MNSCFNARIQLSGHSPETVSLYVTLYHCIQTNVCAPLYSAKGIDDAALNKK